MERTISTMQKLFKGDVYQGKLFAVIAVVSLGIFFLDHDALFLIQSLLLSFAYLWAESREANNRAKATAPSSNCDAP